MESTPRKVVAYLTGEFPRVTDTWIRREIVGLTKRGISVHAFSVRRPGIDTRIDAEDSTDTPANPYVDTTYLLELARSPRLATSLLRLLLRRPRRLAAATRLAWATRRPGTKGTLYQLFYLLEAVLLADELERRGIQHLHNHLADSSCTVAMLAATITDVPFSFTIHGAAIFFEPYTWRLDEKIRRAAFVVAISNYARSQAAVFADNADFTKLHVVHCGVQPNRYQAISNAASGSRGDGGRLIFVGRLVAGKGVTVLLRALHQLNTSPLQPELSLTVVGDGPDRVMFEREATELGLGSQVSFVGSRSPAEVAGLLADADIFVLPSFSEGLPVVLMEAMASELPVVSTGIAGVPELVVHGETGLVVPPTDIQSLSEAIIRLAADPILRTELGVAGRKKVLAEFDSEIEAGKLVDLILRT